MNADNDGKFVEDAMPITRTPPVFCDHCSALAVAQLDGAPHCTACLINVVRKDYEGLLNLVEPLRFFHDSRRVAPVTKGREATISLSGKTAA